MGGGKEGEEKASGDLPTGMRQEEAKSGGPV